MTPRRRLGATTLAVAAITAAGLLTAPASAFGHGYVGGSSSTLISRAAWSANADRGAVQFEPQSLEAPKGFPAGGPADGRLASAGGLFGGTLDEQTATRWQKNVVEAGPVQVAWSLTAAHRTAQWRYFITKPGWDPNDELERADLEPLATFDGRGDIPAVPTVHTLTIPSTHTGYHVIYAVWDIADTTNAFYNTIDIDVRGGGAGTTPPVTTPPVTVPPVTVPPVTVPPVSAPPTTAPPVTTPPTATAPGTPSGVHSMGRTASSVDLMWKGAAGATSYRIERSTDGIAYSAVGTSVSARYLDSGLAAGTTYRYRIVAVSAAGEAASAVFTVSTTAAAPTPPAPVTPPVTTPAVGIPAWTAVGTYTRGDLRRHEGVVYRAVQSHRAWGDPSWITALALWEPVGTR
ncbi:MULTISPECIES: lytic polysaccharide monooxygenase [unclassified Microbacterium]|uniref:lytic polysaccharide monooxygenase n=1 Tax=unclassified Microbacterium TaxID=2609290 RepID=UPI00341F0C01